MGNIEKWEILSNGLIHNININKYLDVASSDLNAKGIITYSLYTPLANNQVWNVTSVANNSFIIQSNLSQILALAPALNSSRLTLVPLNQSDPSQIWTWRGSCPSDCNGNGVCSYTTGNF